MFKSKLCELGQFDLSLLESFMDLGVISEGNDEFSVIINSSFRTSKVFEGPLICIPN